MKPKRKGLICPSSQERCIYGDYCAFRIIKSRKIGLPHPAIREKVRLIDDKRYSDAPIALQEARRSSFCSEEMIGAVALAANIIKESSTATPEEKIEASSSAIAIEKRITFAREYSRSLGGTT